ncbi:MAG: hypothetical protein GTO41_02805, partial [Burkholderiales bacterium]|nr:hypothetical protein [Burkholderiales bacterium]
HQPLGAAQVLEQGRNLARAENVAVDVAGYWGMGVLCLLAQEAGIERIEIPLIGGDHPPEVNEPAIKAIATSYSMLF